MEAFFAQYGPAILTAVLGGVGAYVGAAVRMALLEQRLTAVEREIQSLRESRHYQADQITEVRALVMRKDRQ